MKAIRVNSPEKMEIIEVDEPIIQNQDEIKIKVKAIGICGSDIGIYLGTNPMAVYPRVIGHEITGEIVEMGSDVVGFSIGDHVTMDPVISCEKCPACLSGRYNICYELKVRGVHVDGGACEYVVIPYKSVYKLSNDTPYEKAVLTEPFSIDCNVMHRADIKSTDTVFVIGAGTIGQTVIRFAVSRGAKVIATDFVDKKLETALKQGAVAVINGKNGDFREELLKLTGGHGPNVVVDAVCTPKTVQDAIEIAAIGGRVITLGFADVPSQICQKFITARELDVRGSRLSNRLFGEVIEAIESGTLNIDDMVSHSFDFTKAQDAFDAILDKNILTEKVLLTF